MTGAGNRAKVTEGNRACHQLINLKLLAESV